MKVVRDTTVDSLPWEMEHNGCWISLAATRNIFFFIDNQIIKEFTPAQRTSSTFLNWQTRAVYGIHTLDTDIIQNNPPRTATLPGRATKD